MFCALLATLVISSNAVSFTAAATGIDTGIPVEFLFADATSDRDYETAYLTDDSLADIAAAFAKAGFPKGAAPAPRACVFWPTGPVVTIEPNPYEVVCDTWTNAPALPVVFTGGNGTTDMPASLFALYTESQSLLTFDDILDQSTNYGRFQMKTRLEKGVKRTFTVRWDGVARTSSVTPEFPGSLTVAEAIRRAEGLAKADSRALKFNGVREGEFYYRAFLPLAKWRDRAERLTQPLEIRLDPKGAATYTIIDEDWSVEGPDPKLTPRTVTRDGARAFKGETAFFYATAATPLETLYAVKRHLPDTIRNYYVYVD